MRCSGEVTEHEYNVCKLGLLVQVCIQGLFLRNIGGMTENEHWAHNLR